MPRKDFDIKTATEQDYINQVLQPSKLRNLARILYQIAQALDTTQTSGEQEIGDLKVELQNLTSDITNLQNDYENLHDVIYGNNGIYDDINSINNEIIQIQNDIQDIYGRLDNR